jgi:hypothetical protein
MTLKELKELGRRFLALARMPERGARTKRARERLKRGRERLARLIEGVHAPTIEALSCAPALKVNGTPRLADIYSFETRLPAKLLDDLVELSALEMQCWGTLARVAEMQVGKAQASAVGSGDPTNDILAKGRGYIHRSTLDAYKAELQGFALGVPPVYQPPIKPDPLVPLKQVCVELGVGRRTIGRCIAESKRTIANVA